MWQIELGLLANETVVIIMQVLISSYAYHMSEGGELLAMKLVSRLRVDIRALVLLSDYVPTLWVWLSTK